MNGLRQRIVASPGAQAAVHAYCDPALFAGGPLAHGNFGTTFPAARKTRILTQSSCRRHAAFGSAAPCDMGPGIPLSLQRHTAIVQTRPFSYNGPAA